MTWKEKYGKTLREEMGMTMKNKIITGICTNIAILGILAIAMFWFYVPSMNSPKHQERVIVSGKRVYENDEGYIRLIFAFKFSDGSIKEFDDTIDVPNNKRGIVYNSLHEGETGLLTYQENMNFISFEKDVEYGGEKIESYRMPQNKAVTLLIGITAICLAIFNILILVAKTIKIIEQKIQATLIEKGKYTKESGDNSYTIKYATFKLADGARLMLIVPRKKMHNSLRENEIGILTYKKSKMHEGNILVGFEYAGEQHPNQPVAQQLPPYSPMVTKHIKFRERLPKLLYYAAGGLLVIISILLLVIVDLPFLAFLGLSMGAFCLFSWPSWNKKKEMNAMPEQCSKATVVEKGNKNGKNYIVFSLADGETKLVFVKHDIYIALMKGDMVVLTFKERENEVNLIGFERIETNDPILIENAKQKIKENDIWDTLAYSKFVNSPEQRAQVKVIGRRRAIFAFEFPDGSVKELHDPGATIRVNDTGILVYKERENIDEHIKKEKSRWRGRGLIRFEKAKPNNERITYAQRK